jgi:O-antigen/teichoic acid export membrane protein
MFSDLGVWQSVVRSPRGRSAEFLGTAGSVQLLRGGLLAALVAACALAVGWGQACGGFVGDTVYADPRLPLLIGLFAGCALLQAGESMNIGLAQRALRGGALARLELATQVCALAVTLGVAWVSRSVWALPAGYLVSCAMRTALSHLALDGRWARPRWDRASLQEILSFGRWIFVSSVIGFGAAQGEKLLLAGQMTALAFGLFSIAATLYAALAAVVGSLNAHVVYPSLSQALQADPLHWHRTYARVQRLADLALGGMTGLLLMLAPTLVGWLYDPRYAQAGQLLQCLAPGLLALRHQVAEQIMFAQGRSAWVSANNALRLAALLGAIPIGQRLGGDTGAVLGAMASGFASWPLSLWFKRREGLLSWATEATWVLPLLGGLALGAAALQVLAHP